MAGHLLFNSGSNKSTLAPQFKWLDNTFKSDLQRGFVVDDTVVGRNAPAVPGPGLALGVRLTRLATLYCSLLPEIQILYSVNTCGNKPCYSTVLSYIFIQSDNRRIDSHKESIYCSGVNAKGL